MPAAIGIGRSGNLWTKPVFVPPGLNDLTLKLDLIGGVGMVLDGDGNVLSWIDQSLNGNNGNDASSEGLDPPFFSPNGMNGRPGVKFQRDGLADGDALLITNSGLGLSGLNQPWSMIYAVQIGLLGQLQTMVEVSGPAIPQLITTRLSATNKYRIVKTSDDGTSVLHDTAESYDLNPHILTYLNNGTATTMRIDGVVTSINNTAYAVNNCTFDRVLIGARRAIFDPVRFTFQGVFGRIMAWNYMLPPNEYLEVEAVLKSNYGTP